jgi:RTX calcium-binding nonapeptide repeat (4 copies)
VRRVGLVLVMMVVALIVGGGVAVAAVKFGTDGRDFLAGTNVADQFFGKGGGDGLVGRAADDELFGGDGKDFLFGGSVRYDEIFAKGYRMVPDGEDRLYGEGGHDCMFGGSQDDVIYGGPGDDEMGFYCYDFIFDTGEDVFFGGPGNDFIWSWDFAGRNPHRDVVHCGGGRDGVIADRLDRLFDCEKVERVGRR